jgi:AcrR family transcriptional regulator
VTATVTRSRSGSTKSDIVVAAARLFADRGFAAVGVQEIAEQVGISAGAIYRHFPSKEAVLHAVLRDSIDAWLAAAEAGTIGRVLQASVQLVVDQPGQLATYARERHGVDGDTRVELARREAQLFDRWSDAIVAARPGLSRTEIVVRQQAVNGVLSSLALRPKGLGRPKLRSLVSEGLLALVTGPAVAPSVMTGERAVAWQAPVLRRDQILAVAMRLFAERGFHGVTMGDIGDAAGMSGPSLYEYVSGKTDLLLDAYDQAGAFVVAGGAAAMSEATSAADALERLIRSYVEVAFDHVDLLVVTSREGASLPTSERPRLARRRRDLHERWASVLRELRADVSPADARTLVRSALALVSSLARQRRGASPSVEATVDFVLAFMLGGDVSSTNRSTHE